MNEFTETLIKYTATPVIVCGIIAWLVKVLFEKYLDKRLEVYKKELDNLSLAYQIKFTSLHEERQKVLKELFHQILEIEQNMLFASVKMQITAGTKEMYNYIDEKNEQINDIIKFINNNEIFFDEVFCNKIKDLIFLANSHMKKITKAGNIQAHGEAVSDQKIINEAYDFYTKFDSDLHIKLIEIKKDLINSYREYLGVSH